MERITASDPMRGKHRLPIPAERTIHSHPSPRKTALWTLIVLTEFRAAFMTDLLLQDISVAPGCADMAMPAKRAHIGAGIRRNKDAFLGYQPVSNNRITARATFARLPLCFVCAPCWPYSILFSPKQTIVDVEHLRFIISRPLLLKRPTA